MTNKNDFSFFVPLEISKATDAQGNEVMKIGGIASTSEKDTDGEFLNPNGFNVDYFKNQGFFNWHHLAKEDPRKIIGEPTKAEIKPEGLYVEGILYNDNPIAKGVYETAQTLQKNSPNRRLGFSIEGKAVKRKNNDKNHPDYKIIEKADITGCAITFMPKNPKTFLDIIKGGVDEPMEEEYDDETKADIEKMLTAGSTTGSETTDKTGQSGSPLKLESVDDNIKSQVNQHDDNGSEQHKKELEITSKLLNKAEAVNFIIEKKTVIETVNNAEKCFDIIKSMYMAKNGQALTEEQIEKGLSTIDKMVQKISKGEPYDEDEQTIKDEAKKEDESKKHEKEEKLNGGNDDIKKSISDLTELVKDKNYSVGVVLKGIFDMLSPLIEKVEAIEKAISENDIQKGVQSEQLSQNSSSQLSTEDIEKALQPVLEITSQFKDIAFEMGEIKKALNAPIQKSITSKPVERQFRVNENDLSKGQEGGVFVSQSDKKRVLDILDKCSFEKGFDSGFANAMSGFENGVPLSKNIIARLQSEHKIVIT